MEQNLQLFILAGVGIVVGATFWVIRYLVGENPKLGEALNKASFIFDVALTAVIGIAKNESLITPEEWDRYQLEADARDLDVRLIAAFYETEAMLESYGIEVNEAVLLMMIERAYQEAKRYQLSEE